MWRLGLPWLSTSSTARKRPSFSSFPRLRSMYLLRYDFGDSNLKIYLPLLIGANSSFCTSFDPLFKKVKQYIGLVHLCKSGEEKSQPNMAHHENMILVLYLVKNLTWPTCKHMKFDLNEKTVLYNFLLIFASRLLSKGEFLQQRHLEGERQVLRHL